MRNAFVDVLCKLANNDKDIFVVAGDLGFGVLDKFSKAYPDNYINAGIAEQNLTAVATGMSLEGKKVFTYSMTNFGVLRCLEQIRNDVAYHNANVKIVSVGAGFTYGLLGMTHYGTEDISIMRAVPNMIIFSPADAFEAEAVTLAAYNTEKPCYIRLGKSREEIVHEKTIGDYKIGKAVKIIDGSEVAVFSTGSISAESFKAAIKLNTLGISTAFYTFPTIKPLDIEVIEKFSRQCKIIVTVEENNIIGGFGSAVAEKMAEISGRNAVLKRIGIPDELPSIVGSQNYLRSYYKMDAESIFNIIVEGGFHMNNSENNLNVCGGGYDKIRVAIIGTGNIGSDLLVKIERSSNLVCNLFAGRSTDSKGMRFAAEKNIPTSAKSIEAVIKNPECCDIVFDATSAEAHKYHAPILHDLGKFTIDLTPALVGKMCVPVLNLDECMQVDNVNMITCGGQATIPLATAISSVNPKSVKYIEIVASISSKSAGAGTRANIDEFTQTTRNALRYFAKSENTKAIIILNSAEPPVHMRNTIYALIDNPDMMAITKKVRNMEKRIQKYVPGYHLLYDPIFENGRVTTAVEVIGNGDYLPRYAGNLDIITCAAVEVAENYARKLLTERGIAA